MNLIRIIGDRLLVREIIKPSPVEIPETVKCYSDEPWECEVVKVGDKLSEDIKPGDRLLVQRTGDQTANHGGEVLRLISTKAVIGILVDIIPVSS